ncbi:MAG: hypothetical protein KOO60_12555 [Gemmatimonadales bacterium]|nr:hypothetical protein [Gemmatimonadales bacterium]
MLSIRRTAPGSILAITVLATLAGVILTGSALASDEAPITLDDFTEALARAQAENKPVVMDFFTDW